MKKFKIFLIFALLFTQIQIIPKTAHASSLPTPNRVSPVYGATGESLTPKLDWSYVSGATSYRIQVNRSSDFGDDSCSTCTVNTLAYSSYYNVPSGKLSNGQIYYWRVRAGNSTQGSLWSSKGKFKTNANPNSPTISPPSSATVNQSVTVNVTIGSDSDNDRVKVQCTADNSNHTSSNKYDSGLYSSSRTVYPSFTFYSTGSKRIYCTTFDENGNASSNVSKYITVNAPINHAPNSPTISPPSSATVNQSVTINVTIGSDSDNDRVKVECVADDSNRTIENNRYKSSLYYNSTTVYPSFTFYLTGYKKISCTTFDEHGKASSTTNEYITIENTTPFTNIRTNKSSYLWGEAITINWN